MQLTGSASWQLEVKDSDLIRHALFVRDAIRLERPVGTTRIPALSTPPPDRSDILAPYQRRFAGEQWARWWHQILIFEFHPLHPDADLGRQPPQSLADYEALSALSNPEAFADRPELQIVVRATADDFRRWQAIAIPVRAMGPPHSPFDWSLIKHAVEDVAFDRHVDLAALRAKVITIPVRGVWWRRVAPGAILCSNAASKNEITAHKMLRDAFESQVNRQL